MKRYAKYVPYVVGALVFFLFTVGTFLLARPILRAVIYEVITSSGPGVVRSRPLQAAIGTFGYTFQQGSVASPTGGTIYVTDVWSPDDSYLFFQEIVDGQHRTMSTFGFSGRNIQIGPSNVRENADNGKLYLYTTLVEHRDNHVFDQVLGQPIGAYLP